MCVYIYMYQTPHQIPGLRQADLLRLGPGQGRPGGGMPGVRDLPGEKCHDTSYT